MRVDLYVHAVRATDLPVSASLRSSLNHVTEIRFRKFCETVAGRCHAKFRGPGGRNLVYQGLFQLGVN